MPRWDHCLAMGQRKPMAWDVRVQEHEFYTSCTATKPVAEANETTENEMDNDAKLASTLPLICHVQKRLAGVSLPSDKIPGKQHSNACP